MTTNETSSNAIPGPLFIIGIVAMLLAIGSSAVLAWQAISGAAIPGCGVDSACAQLGASVWGKVPGIGWPTSHVGTAYFAAILVAWLGSRGGVSGQLKWVIRLGALFSIGFVIVMLVEGHLCQYCIAAHLGNFALLAVSELSGRAAPTARLPLGLTAGGFVAVTALLFIGDSIVQNQVQQQAEDDLEQATQNIIDRNDPDGDNGAVNIDGNGDGSGDGFTGRYRIGAEDQPIRIVMFMSYQCPDCEVKEAEIFELLEERDDISLSVKHFPMCADCNDYMNGSCPHRNSCWASRAAETAGILRGNDGFWEMHHWLFNKEEPGSFTAPVLQTALTEMGYNPQEFISIMTSDRTLDLIKADIEEGVGLAIHYTPMIFVNGVELYGWNAPNSVRRMVEQVAATNPPRRTATADRPPLAMEKIIGDWQRAGRRSLPADTSPHRRGSSTPKHTITIWADYEHTASGRLNGWLRDIMAERDDILVEWRHYPIDEMCNPNTGRTAYPNACIIARAVEAAGILGGDDGYWRMHDYMLDNQGDFSPAVIQRAAAAVGLDYARLQDTMNSPEVATAIVDDCNTGKSVGLRQVPWVFINGKRAPRWQQNENSYLAEMLEHADGLSP